MPAPPPPVSTRIFLTEEEIDNLPQMLALKQASIDAQSSVAQGLLEHLHARMLLGTEGMAVSPLVSLVTRLNRVASAFHRHHSWGRMVQELQAEVDALLGQGQ